MRSIETLSTMRILTILLAVVALSIPALGQVEAVPTFTVTTNDVTQSSIMAFRMGATNEARVTVKFAFTDSGAKRVEEFYRAHTVGQEVRYRIGTSSARSSWTTGSTLAERVFGDCQSRSPERLKMH